ncbi:hypothetical protein CERSUDRAFT_113501 [Gelatoporia subvermispora B]|uniref:Alpha-ketoglutarate-dependent dioxygenase AlkB-like domain-containing protein n=1 Tax=Ceriporiopsis subvermispora (strain B) TaxID=914234 RepID=M2PPC7_CERS8|nr:hypothetical protein CERSUDRAFT_113501 [Gelatoporia subvermispora B]
MWWPNTFRHVRVTNLAKRSLTMQAADHIPDFAFFKDFYSIPEQRILLSAALLKLDSTETRQFRKRRMDYVATAKNTSRTDAVDSLFLPDEYYGFEEGHYDGVIKNYREMHITSWPEDIPEVGPLLTRLQSLHPDEETQTHILHLATDGEILPHVDNIGASGSWILGVSLGATRIMRLENTERSEPAFDIALPSGSVYMQRDSIRYGHKHSILRNGVLSGHSHNGGQRLSIMVRNLLSHR